MLNIIYGEIEKDNYIFDPDTFFNHQMHVNWIEVDFNDFNNTINKAISLIEKQK